MARATRIEDSTLSSVIEPLPVTLSMDDLLSKALGAMRKHELHEVAIVDEKGRVQGVLSQETLMRRRRVPLSTAVRHLAVNPPVLTEGDSVARAAKVMLENGFREVLVTDGPGGRALGQVTRSALLEVLARDVEVAALEAGQVMTPDPVVVREGERAEKALVEMSKLGEPTLPVVDGGGSLTGVISASDVLRTYAGGATPAHTMRRSPKRTRKSATTVGSFMSTPALAARRGQKVGGLIDTMVKHGSSSVVVVDGERPVGIVTRSDLLELLASSEPEEGCFIQLTGLERHDPFLTDEVYTVVDPGVLRVAAFARPLTLYLHVMEHHRASGHRVECRVRLNTDRGLYVAKSEDDSIMRAVAEVMSRLERQVKRDVDRGRPNPKKARSGVTKPGHAKVM
jgi:CBS domain-containing protein/ribosome-associated translation inhibitor RaiA